MKVGVCLGLVAVMAAGCGSGGNGAPPAEQTEQGAITEETGPSSRPGLQVVLAPAFDAAEVRLGAAVDRCLTGQGLPALDATPVEVGAAVPGFGITTTFGVLPDGRPAGSEVAAPVDPAQEEATSAQLLALFGDPGGDDDPALAWGGGCLGSAAQEVYGDAEPYLDLEEALDELTAAVAADPRRRRALVGWQACMQEEAGVAPADPESLVGSFADEVDAEFFATGDPVEYPAPD